ncbi:MAG: L,D-transpeptidase family protein [Magnetococcales bacterium]|nr:L,D-transpeptidase family protein [Magnetococcales bacterium]
MATLVSMVLLMVVFPVEAQDISGGEPIIGNRYSSVPAKLAGRFRPTAQANIVAWAPFGAPLRVDAVKRDKQGGIWIQGLYRKRRLWYPWSEEVEKRKGVKTPNIWNRRRSGLYWKPILPALPTPPAHWLTTLSASADPKKELGKRLTVLVPTLDVHARPTSSSKVMFRLMRGMRVVPDRVKTGGGYVWYRIPVLDKAFWIKRHRLGDADAVQSGDGLAVARLSHDQRTTLLSLPPAYRGKLITVDKKKRLITFWRIGKTTRKIISFPITIGFNNVSDPKQKKGDMRVPSGFYYISRIQSESTFGLDPKTGAKLPSFELSYPGPMDAWKGLNRGAISLTEYRSIIRRSLDRGEAYRGTALGDLIMIHGGAESFDYTLGCVALSSDLQKRIVPWMQLGIPVFLL